MFEVTKKQVHWGSEGENTYEWDMSCPFCGSSGEQIDMGETWVDLPLDFRVEICQNQGISIFLARHDDPPHGMDWDRAARMFLMPWYFMRTRAGI